MRNLVLKALRKVPADGQRHNDIRHFTVDYDTGQLRVCVVTKDAIYSLTSTTGRANTFDVEELVPLSEFTKSPDDVLAAEYLNDLESLCLALSSGDVLLYNFLSCDFKCVGGIEAGLTAMSWSPDQELVVLVSREENLILMTMNFDPVAESSLNTADFGEAQPVNVGWGKKETQFHGSQGKQRTQEATPLNPAHPSDDRCPRVRWSGDGQSFASSHIEPSTGARRIRIWSRSGVLQATNEGLDGLGQCLDWRPSGGLIGSSQMRPHRQEIVFFERNGLQHGGFPLPGTTTLVEELCWNNRSSVLALRLRADSAESLVQLWTVGNYHWYLKQEIRVDSIAGVQWDPIQPLRLHILKQDGEYTYYDWVWSVCANTAHSLTSAAGVCVIDGHDILYTPFRFSVVPPPMAGHVISLAGHVTSVAFSPTCNSFVASVGTNQIALCECEDSLKPRLVGVVKCKAVLCLTWWRRDSILAIGSTDDSQLLVEYTITREPELKLSVSQSVVAKCCVDVLVCNPNTGTVVAGASPACVVGPRLELTPREPDTSLPAGIEFDHIALAVFNGKEYMIGLNEFDGSLWVGPTRLTSGCTSFAVHNEFLLYTTTSHKLKFLSLAVEPKIPDGQADENDRSIERGSKLVTVVPYDSRVVLQMPRGNLETINPRALVLSSVRSSLDQLQFRSAFQTMRKHRVNLNLIHDHNPQVFMSNVCEFVKQLDSVSHINLFLTELREEGPSSQQCGKVTTVCAAVRNTIETLDKHKYLLSIITTYVRESSPNLEAVLAILKQLKDSPSHDALVSAEDAIKYTVFLVDVNELYKVALGMYDFELVLLVAEKSQKDPKEYLPFLNELRRLPVDYQRYKIDLHLQRFDKALTHISKCGADKFPECLALITNHSLYRQALGIFDDHSSTEHKEIAKNYGHYLRSREKHNEAGIMFFQCGEYDEALRSFERSLDWKLAFVVASCLQLPTTEAKSLAKRLASSLKTNKRYSEAAQVLIDYAHELEESVLTLIDGGCWQEAIRLAHLNGCAGLIETHVLPGAQENYQSQLLLFDGLEANYRKHSDRLEVVRKIKREKQAAILEGTYVADERDVDLFSDTSSMTGVSTVNSSIMSKASGRSSKNRRKAERKKHSLREGSAHEDMALLEALSETVVTVDRLQDETASLLNVLMMFGQIEQGKALQSAFDRLVCLVRDKMPTIWASEPVSSDTGLQVMTGPGATVNSILAGLKSKPTTPFIPVSAPKLRDSVKWKLDLFLST